MNGAPALFLGVDGGGTGCRARIEDSSGAVLGLGEAGPATTRLGISKAWESIRAAYAMAIAEAGLEPPDVSRIHAAVGYRWDFVARVFKSSLWDSCIPLPRYASLVIA